MNEKDRRVSSAHLSEGRAKDGAVRTVIILGAAGRDFHDFNVVFRSDPRYRVLAFTAAQIPDIGGRRYPPELAGPLYPKGIPIVAEVELEDTIAAAGGVDEIVFAYSDVPHLFVMHQASRALAAGSDYTLLGPRSTISPLSSFAIGWPFSSISAISTSVGRPTEPGLRRSRGFAAIWEVASVMP